jgi:hypothetical protein
VRPPLRAEVAIAPPADGDSTSLGGAAFRFDLVEDRDGAPRLAGLDCVPADGGFSVGATTASGPGAATVAVPPGVAATLAVAHDGTDVVLEVREGRAGVWTEIARAPLAGTAFRLAVEMADVPAGATFRIDDLSLVDAAPPPGTPAAERAPVALRRALVAQADAIGRLERFERETGGGRLDDAFGLLAEARAALEEQGLRKLAKSIRAAERGTSAARRLLSKGRPLDTVIRKVDAAARREGKVLAAVAPD